VKNYHDVIIIGAGPIGSYTAYLLSKKGFNVGIFEKNLSIGKNINCTGIISEKCYKKIGIKEDILVRSVYSIKAYSPSGNHISYYSSEPIAYIIDRMKFDIYMNEMANGEGAKTYLNANVEKIRTDGSSFKIVANINNECREFRSKIGVIATGYCIDSVYRSLYKRRTHYFGIQAKGVIDNLDSIEVYFGNQIAPGSFGWLAPYKGSEVMVGLIVKDDPIRYLKRFLKEPLISHRIHVKEKSIKCSLLPIGMNVKTYGDRVLVVGEAAAQVKTTTGGGIYFGMLCSEIAVNTIIKAFERTDFSENLLKEYQVMWLKKIGPELKAGKVIRSIFSRLSDKQIDILMDIAKRDGFLPMIRNMDFDWHRDAIFYIIKNIISKGLSNF
jgi:geranylgeranyl reductase family protein